MIGGTQKERTVQIQTGADGKKVNLQLHFDDQLLI